MDVDGNLKIVGLGFSNLFVGEHDNYERSYSYTAPEVLQNKGSDEKKGLFIYT